MTNTSPLLPFSGARGSRHEALRDVDGSATLVFAWEKNPLPMNGGRRHWRTHSAAVRQVRNTSAWLAALAVNWADRPLPRVRVHLTQYVSDARKRDADNLGQLAKAVVDGLTTAGVIADDNDEIVTRVHPSIVRTDGPAHFELTITREAD
jgi:Holliday junction resolvase RusA-like endonuclease